jgi:chloramphenicol 3-O phosphotransferase
MTGRVVLLIGSSCAGKSTLTKALQDASPTPFVALSLDGLFAGVPDRWGSQGDRAHEGLRYEWLSADVRRIVYGDVGWRMLQGMHRAAAAYANAGTDVVVDDMLLDEGVLADWAESLAEVPTLLVRLTAPLQELVRREQARTRHQTLGLTAGHYDLHEAIAADLVIDTSLVTAEAAAEATLRTAFPAPGQGALHAPPP